MLVDYFCFPPLLKKVSISFFGIILFLSLEEVLESSLFELHERATTYKKHGREYPFLFNHGGFINTKGKFFGYEVLHQNFRLFSLSATLLHNLISYILYQKLYFLYLNYDELGSFFIYLPTDLILFGQNLQAHLGC